MYCNLHLDVTASPASGTCHQSWQCVHSGVTYGVNDPQLQPRHLGLSLQRSDGHHTFNSCDGSCLWLICCFLLLLPLSPPNTSPPAFSSPSFCLVLLPLYLWIPAAPELWLSICYCCVCACARAHHVFLPSWVRHTHSHAANLSDNRYLSHKQHVGLMKPHQWACEPTEWSLWEVYQLRPTQQPSHCRCSECNSLTFVTVLLTWLDTVSPLDNKTLTLGNGPPFINSFTSLFCSSSGSCEGLQPIPAVLTLDSSLFHHTVTTMLCSESTIVTDWRTVQSESPTLTHSCCDWLQPSYDLD